MAVEREAFERAFERTFNAVLLAESERGVVVEENDQASPAGNTCVRSATPPEKPLFSMDPFEVAEIMELPPVFWRSA